jgi:hypothetical protein
MMGPDMTIFSSKRRDVLKLMAGTALLPLMVAGKPAMAQDVALRAIVISDLHSAYERIGQLLAAVETRIAADKAPHIILLNGDLFEIGNAVAARSAGEIEWTFLAALAKLAPTVINIGNHEPDIDNDLSNFVTRAQALGITVLSNIIDKRKQQTLCGGQRRSKRRRTEGRCGGSRHQCDQHLSEGHTRDAGHSAAGRMGEGQSAGDRQTGYDQHRSQPCRHCRRPRYTAAAAGRHPAGRWP